MDLEEDRISELPKPLILHILSFLPTKLAVSTTVLSKRWHNLWISMPVFDFREWTNIHIFFLSLGRLFEKTNRFMEFLDRILLSDNISKIRKFGLSCDNKLFDENRVKEWITAVIKRKVEELILIVKPPNPKLVPLDIFTCESLTVLDIDLYLHHVLDFPQSISLPRLKVLRLSGVKFKDTASTQKLFSNCPILEELVLNDCSGEDIICFSAPQLKKFSLEKSYYLKVEIDAPNLLSIKFRGRLPTDFQLASFPSLVEVDLSYSSPERTITKYSFTRMCSNVKLLKVSGDYLQIFDTQNVNSTTIFPAMDNLLHLEVGYMNEYYHTTLFSIRSLFNFLRLSPHLESLVIYQESTQKMDENMIKEFRAPSCLLLHLKSIEFRNFNGSPEEMELVKLILKYARVLERVIIRSAVSQDFSTGIIEKLLSFPKASKNCSSQAFETEC